MATENLMEMRFSSVASYFRFNQKFFIFSQWAVSIALSAFLLFSFFNAHAATLQDETENHKSPVATSPGAEIAPPSKSKEAIPFRNDVLPSDSSAHHVLWTLVGLFSVAILVFLFVFRLNSSRSDALRIFSVKHWFEKPSGKQLDVIASRQLTTKNSLHVVRWQGRLLLLGSTEKSINLLSEIAVGEHDDKEKLPMDTEAKIFK